ncbi:MAG: pseudouridine synthase [Beijerinckiaceae bacterium]
MRLDRWFRHRFPGLAMSHLNRIVRKGEVRVNGKRAETATRLETGDAVRVPPLRLDDPALPAVRRAVENEADLAFLQSITLYEDAHILVLNKPFGLAVQGGPGVKRHVDGLLEVLTHNGQKPRLVHRIDRDTSGVLLVARTRKMAADLGEIFRTRHTKKIYWSVVRGVPKPAQGRISLFLKKGPGMTGERSLRSSQRHGSGGGQQGFRGDPEKMQIAKHGDDDAQHSVTYYTIVDKVAPRLAWLSMKPITGRTHQLRAHAEAIGHPIIGDPKYALALAVNDPRNSDPLRALPSGIENKLHLLARRLILPNPRGGILDVTAPLPPHMQKTFDMFGFDIQQYDPIDDAPE